MTNSTPNCEIASRLSRTGSLRAGSAVKTLTTPKLLSQSQGSPQPTSSRQKLGMTVRELYALKQPETLIENLLAVEDVTILSAKPKVGKTNLLVGLLAENLNRGTWLGEAAKELRCVYLGEEPGHRFGKRLRDSLVSEDTARTRFAYLDARSLNDVPTWQEKLERVRAYIDAISIRPNLLVIDTLGFWAGLSDFNDYATVSKEFRPVLGLRL